MATARKLRLIRLDSGLSQRRLAASAGVSRMTVRRLERGERARTGTIAKLAAALRLQPDDLVD